MKKPKDKLKSVERLAKFLVEFKEANKMTTATLARKTGIHVNILGRIMSHAVDPRLTTVDTIAEGLGIDPVELLKP